MALLQLWPILLFFAAGYALKHTGRVPENLPHQLNMVAIRLVFPALILATVPFLDTSASAGLPVLAAYGCAAVAILAVVLLARLTGIDRETRCALLILTALGNTGFLGVPMLKTLAGVEPLTYAILFDQFGTFILLSSYALLVVSLQSGEKLHPGKMLIDILSFPPLLALVAAMLLPAQWLAPVQQPLLLISKLVIPLTMLSIGMKFRFLLPRHHIGPLVAALVIKMLLLPLVVLAAAQTLGVDADIQLASVFQAATPPMVTGAALLMSRNIASDLTAAILGFGTLLSFIWLPLVLLVA